MDRFDGTDCAKSHPHIPHGIPCAIEVQLGSNGVTIAAMQAKRSNFLYGDSTASTLQTNFLEFLRDAIDFSVAALKSDQRIHNAHARIAALQAEADRQTQDLERFVATVANTIESSEKEADSPTTQCAAHLMSLSRDALHTFKNVIAAKLQSDIAQAQAEESAARDAASAALGALLAPHEPPDATSTFKIEMNEAGQYEGFSEGEAKLGLAWSLLLHAPAGHVWAEPVRFGRFVPAFEVSMPQVVSGWLGKGVKVLPQKIDGYILTSCAETDGTTHLRLRSDADPAMGLRLDVNAAKKIAKMMRTAGAEEAEIELKPEEVQRLLEVPEKLSASIAGFVAATLKTATVDGKPFRNQPTFQAFVERLMSMMAPVTHVISERSLMPTELVIRKLLGNDRREEIFVAKAVLREKYASLPEAQRAIFAPLGLEATTRVSQLPAGVSVRAELAPSRPPPPMPEASTVATAPPPEPIKAAIHRIMMLAKGGDTEAAYREYTKVFEGPGFVENRVEDQRAGLRFFLLGKTPVAMTEAAANAYRAAVARATHLLTQIQEPIVYEMIGAGHAVLGDVDAAKQAFDKGLALENDRDGSSDQAASLKKRIAELGA